MQRAIRQPLPLEQLAPLLLRAVEVAVDLVEHVRPEQVREELRGLGSGGRRHGGARLTQRGGHRPPGGGLCTTRVQ